MNSGPESRRKFCPWSRPFLPQLVAWLHERGEQTTACPCDLSQFLVVLPTAASRRRTLTLLADATAGAMRPPQLLTPAEFPEQLYPLKKPLASRQTQTVAWKRAIEAQRPEVLRSLVPHGASLTEGELTALAELLDRETEALARDDSSFAKVRDRLEAEGQTEELDRWTTLAAIEDEYLNRQLESVGLWDRQAARLFAIAHDECECDRHIVLAAMTDLNRIVEQMVRQVAGKGTPVTSLVHADESTVDRFDEWGGLRPEAWAAAPLVIDEVDETNSNASSEKRIVLVADDPSDQTEAVLDALASLPPGAFAAADIAVGCPDDRTMPRVDARLKEVGVPSRIAFGRPVLELPPCRFLQLLTEHLEQPTPSTCLQLLAHPATDALLGEVASGEALRELDAFREQHVLPHFTSEHLRQEDERQVTAGRESRLSAAIVGVEVVESLVARFADDPRPLTQWSLPIRDTLERVFPFEALTDETPRSLESRQCLQQIDQTLTTMRRLPAEFQPNVEASSAIRELLQQLRGVSTQPDAATEGVEVTGWLELPLDDRPVAIVCDFNEGVVPTSVTSDLFLPGSVRSQLGLSDNTRRLARDAYATQVLLKSRPHVRLIVPRRTAEGDPVAPSRLLFRETPAKTATRMREILQPPPKRTVRDGFWSAATANTVIERIAPRSQPVESLTISVTAFKTYLTCPFDYFLKQEEGLREVDRNPQELSPLVFGNLLHDVLALFGRTSPECHSRDASEIESFCIEALERVAAARFGRDPLAAVRIQIETARARLRDFATHQVKHREDGWEIVSSEHDDGRDTKFAPLDLESGRSCTIKGRIDRIDWNERDKRWCVIDYKTGDEGETPRSSHGLPKKDTKKKSGAPIAWKNLQLPLYYLLLDKPFEQVEAAFFNLGSGGAVGVQHAGFTSEEIDSAIAEAKRIAEAILDGEFEAKPKAKHVSFSGIRQSDVLSFAVGDDA